MSRMDRGRPTRQPDGFTYDPFAFAGQPGEWGRPDMDQGPAKPRAGWLERAMEALTIPDRRFEALARRVDQLFRS